ncbi:hypothetical protein ACHAW6_001939 [Cyclotella cf. meneghiniana]
MPISQGHMLFECISVARVHPRTSKGTTDQLLLPSSFILIKNELSICQSSLCLDQPQDPLLVVLFGQFL